jgi:hypothetical protein
VFWPLSAALIAVILAISAPRAEDGFPIVGTYTRDIACKGDGSDRPDLRVRITRDQIESQMGVCRILSRKREGKAYMAHVECKIPGADQPILGEVTFTVRDDNTLEFEDQDHTSDATLHKCTG